MATAAGLNATSTIINGQGLNVNPAMMAALTTFQSHTPISTIKTVFSAATLPQVFSEVDNIGTGVTKGLWLIDSYPGNISPTYSRPIPSWEANVDYAVGSLVKYSDRVYTVTGNIFGSSFANVVTNATLTGASEIIRKQALLPFAYGMAGFANAVTSAQGFAGSVFDTVASIKMLESKTYGTSGLKYNGLTDLVTGGIGNTAGLLGNTVSTWGTMYNITNVNLIVDPYVFGQNLLNQDLGSYGDLANKLAATGLDIDDITRVPATLTTTTQETAVTTSQTSIGEIDLPTVANVVTVNTVTGNSPTVVIDIYKTITGADLASIVSATGFTTNPSITTLADLLDFTKVVPLVYRTPLAAIGVTNFAEFTEYLNSRVGQANFRNWQELGNFLKTVSVPNTPNIVTTSSTPVLNASTISTLRAQTGEGSGPFGNPVMSDYFGATAGMGYINRLSYIELYYDAINPGLNSLFTSLLSAVNTYVTDYIAWEGTAIPESSPGAGDGIPPVGPEPSLSPVTTLVSSINSALGSLSGAAVSATDVEYYRMLNKLATEVSNLSRAGVSFGTAPATLLLGFGQRIANLVAEDQSGIEMDLFMANLITNDVHGDTIRAAAAEQDNIGILSRAGISFNNDPNPRQAISQAKSQNIPLSTYLSRNK